MAKGRPLTVEEYKELAQVIRSCARTAINQTKKAIAKQKTYNDSSVSDEWFNQLFECYSASDYAVDVPSDYKEYVRKQARLHMQYEIGGCFDDHTLRSIMIPVLFYSLIIQHEHKKQTVDRRINKIQEAKFSEKSEPEWKRTDLFRGTLTHYFVNAKEEYSFAKTLKAQRALMAKCSYYDNPLISTEFKQATAQYENLQGHLHYLDCLSDAARMGAFLCDILKLPENENHALNTIIRMACINSYESVLETCGFISSRSRRDFKVNRKTADFSNIFMAYGSLKTGAIYLENDMIHPVPVFYIGTEEKPPFTELKRTAINQKDTFAVIYNFLERNFRFETVDIIDMILDKEALAPFISFEKNRLKFMSANKKVTRLLTQLNDIVAELNNIIVAGEFISDNEKGISSFFQIHHYTSFEEEEKSMIDEKYVDYLDFDEFDDPSDLDDFNHSNCLGDATDFGVLETISDMVDSNREQIAKFGELMTQFAEFIKQKSDL